MPVVAGCLVVDQNPIIATFSTGRNDKEIRFHIRRHPNEPKQGVLSDKFKQDGWLPAAYFRLPFL